jgi:hypothetical protein
MASTLAAEAASVGIGADNDPRTVGTGVPEVGRDGQAGKALLPLATRVTSTVTSLPPHGLRPWRQSC